MPEVEPRVLTEDVQIVLRRVIHPDNEDEGESVEAVAKRANTSPRTVYRVLARTTYAISLDLADRLCIAAGTHLQECRLVWADDSITPYIH